MCWFCCGAPSWLYWTVGCGREGIGLEELFNAKTQWTWKDFPNRIHVGTKVRQTESAFPTQNPINRITTLTEHYNRELHHREMSHCHCSYCSRQLNSSFKHPCEGASGQHNAIPSPSADYCSWLYPQHILLMQSALWEILRRCSPVVLQTVSIDAALFFFFTLTHVHTHLKNCLFAEKCNIFQEKKSIFLFSVAINFKPGSKEMPSEISYLQL